jgi:DNA replication protein DnaC
MTATARLETMRDFLNMVGPRYATASFASFEERTAELTAAKTKVKEWVDRYPTMFTRGEGLILYGPCGTGKDHLATAAARRLILRYGCHIYESKRRAHFVDSGDDPNRTIYRVTGDELFSGLRAVYSDDGNEHAYINRFIRPGVLILSDPIGTAAPRTTEGRIELLSSIINKRYELMRPMIITVNASGKNHLNEMITTALADRVRHQATAVQVPGDSFRSTR